MTPASSASAPRRSRSSDESGRTIVLVSHATGQVEQLCEQALWLERGEVKMIGPSVEVVGVYTGASHGAESPAGDEELGQRWGSHEAEIASVELLDENGEEAKVFTTLGPMHVRVNIVAHNPIRDPVVGVRIDQLQGTPLWGTSTRRRHHTIDIMDGACTVDLEITALSLMEGTYDLTVYVADHTEALPFDHWERRIRFEVRQTDIYDTGTVYMPTAFTSTTRRRTRA